MRLLFKSTVSKVLAGVVGIVCVAIGFVAFDFFTFEKRVTHYVRLPILDNGTRIGLLAVPFKFVEWTTPSLSKLSPFQLIRLSYPASYMFVPTTFGTLHTTTHFALTDVAQLKGHVHIASPEDAVTFVRLPATPELNGCIGRPKEAQREIVSLSSYRKLPLQWQRVQPLGVDSDSASLFVLPDAVFTRSKVNPIAVTHIAGGYRIVRTIVSSTEDWFPQFQTVQEDVGYTGSYKCKILSGKLAPESLLKYQNYPDTQSDLLPAAKFSTRSAP